MDEYIKREDAEMQGKILSDQGEVLQHLTADGIAAYVAHRQFMDSHQHDATSSAAAAAPSPQGEGKEEGDGPPRASAPTGEPRSFDPDEYLRERAEEDAEYLDRMGAKLDYFLNHLPGLVHNRQEGIKMFKKRFRQTGTGGGRVDHTGVGNGLELSRGGNKLLRSWTEAYDVFCCAAVNRLSKMPQAESEEPEETEPAFASGTPPRDGRYFVRIDMGDGGTHEAVGSWRGGSWSVFNGPLYETMKVTGWYPLPEKGERKDA